MRNQITFEKKVVRSPVVTIFSMCAFLHYWAGLYGPADAELVRGGADQLAKKAVELAGARTATDAAVPVGMLLITDH
jgi:transcriptional regulator of met regulon